MKKRTNKVWKGLLIILSIIGIIFLYNLQAQAQTQKIENKEEQLKRQNDSLIVELNKVIVQRDKALDGWKKTLEVAKECQREWKVALEENDKLKQMTIILRQTCR